MVQDEQRASTELAVPGAARKFKAYCEADRERRLDSGADFDPGVYDEAICVVLQKLSVSEVEEQR